MKNFSKKALCLVFALIMLLAVCVPAFAANEKKADDAKFYVVLKVDNEWYDNMKKPLIRLWVRNDSKETKDIEVNIDTTPFLTAEKKTIVFENVKPGVTRYVSFRALTHRNELPIYILDKQYRFVAGTVAVGLTRFIDFVKKNTGCVAFEVKDATAAVLATAHDITPEPETQKPETDTQVPETETQVPETESVASSTAVVA